MEKKFSHLHSCCRVIFSSRRDLARKEKSFCKCRCVFAATMACLCALLSPVCVCSCVREKVKECVCVREREGEKVREKERKRE